MRSEVTAEAATEPGSPIDRIADRPQAKATRGTGNQAAAAREVCRPARFARVRRRSITLAHLVAGVCSVARCGNGTLAEEKEAA
ncbi:MULTISPECIES: hypothetical protein [unclassified Streptomyces]|uniref:hypothetical protein n=1 Tax=unclassified Streptomyces TaxID=2593676 RepID=UPI0033A3B4AF